jgi:hypothetical protein
MVVDRELISVVCELLGVVRCELLLDAVDSELLLDVVRCELLLDMVDSELLLGVVACELSELPVPVEDRMDSDDVAVPIEPVCWLLLDSPVAVPEDRVALDSLECWLLPLVDSSLTPLPVFEECPVLPVVDVEPLEPVELARALEERLSDAPVEAAVCERPPLAEPDLVVEEP